MTKQNKTWWYRWQDMVDKHLVAYTSDKSRNIEVNFDVNVVNTYELGKDVKQEILSVLDEVEQVYKGKLIGITRTTSGEDRFYVWHDELYAKIEEIKKRYEK